LVNGLVDELKLDLSPRLQAVMGFIGDGDALGILADIGTDHGYLPIAAVQAGLCRGAIACDLHPGPLAIAKKNIRDAGLAVWDGMRLCEGNRENILLHDNLAGRIEVRLGNGLLPLLPGEADVIVISGMGGMRIWGIVSEGMAQSRQAKRLILQPQHDIVLLRKKLHETRFEIQDEVLVREIAGGKEHFYVVMSVRYADEVFLWTEQEYFLGKHLLAKGGDVFTAHKRCEKEKIEAYISQIKDETSHREATERLEWLI